MVYFLKVIYNFVLPPGLFIVALLWLCWRLRKRDRLGAQILLAVTLVLYIVSTPFVGGTLIHSLETDYVPPKQPTGDVIIMLGGGATKDTPDITGTGQPFGDSTSRLITAYFLYQKLHVPVLLSGGDTFEDSGNESQIDQRYLLQLGVPQDMILIEDKSRTTKENAEFSKPILDEHHFQQPILVTSAYHMRRAVHLFSEQHISVVPYPTNYYRGQEIGNYLNQWVPTANGLLSTWTALHEYLGLLQ